jgi:hypothetical protein
LGEDPGIDIQCISGASPKRKRTFDAAIKQSSGPLVATKRAANSKNKSLRKNNTKTRQDSQATERHFYWVTHGQTNAGFVDQVDGTYKAIGADERELGTFSTFKAAADAVSARHDRGSRLELLDGGVS